MKTINSTSSANREFGFLTLREATVLDASVRLAFGGAAVFLALLNASIAVAFLVQKVRRPVRVSPSGLLVLNLLFADAFLGVTTTVLSSRVAAVPYRCGISTGVMFLATVGSQSALFNVVLDRYIAIAYSLQYRRWMSMTRSRVMLLCGWCIPLVGLVYGVVSNNWKPGPANRCLDIRSVGMFLRYGWAPVDVFFNLCVIVIQCCVYLHLRRHDAGRVTSNAVRSCSHKAARVLFWVVTPTCVVQISYDVVLNMPRLNSVLRSIYMVLLMCAQLSVVLNPVVYSYATANIKKPVSDLCKDIKVWLCREPLKGLTPCGPQKDSVFFVEVETCTNTSPCRT